MKKPDYRSVDYSRTTITELMIPAYANFGGKIHGGTILSLMDKVAYTCAAKHSGGYCVTASMNVVDFLAPVEVGNLVHLHGSVNYVGKSSMVIGIKVESEDIHTGEKTHTNSSYMTMVAVDEHKKSRPIPGLILENKQDAKRFLEAIKRKELVNVYRKESEKIGAHLEVSDEIDRLEKENCMVIDL